MMRNIAMSTCVTLLVPHEQRDRANGLVGSVTGVSFAITSVFSGLVIGSLGMGWAYYGSLALTLGALAHLRRIEAGCRLDRRLVRHRPRARPGPHVHAGRPDRRGRHRLGPGLRLLQKTAGRSTISVSLALGPDIQGERMRARPAVVVATLIVLSGGMSWAAEPKQTTCTANGTALQIASYDNKYDKDCMAVPPDQAFTIEFKNEDRGIPHNVSLFDKSGGTEKTLYKGEIIDGGTIVYEVPAQPKGNYIFRCDPHPEFMVGTFIVG
jgi:plastocyanin